MFRHLTIAATAFCIAQPAFAQTAQPSPEALARADAIIAAAGAADLFQNVSEGATPAVKHKASGLICRFSLTSAAGRITLFPNPVRGNDIGCTNLVNGVLITLYATKVTPAHDLRRDFLGAYESIKAIYPDVQPYEGATANPVAPGMPVNQSGIFLFSDKEGRTTGKPDSKVMSRLSVTIVPDSWELKMRASAPSTASEAEKEPAIMAFSLMTGMVWMEALKPFSAPQAKEPAI